VLWWSTLYLRFHYFVDLLAGVAVALIGVWTANRYAQASLEQPLEAYRGECQEIPLQE
jgi:membrane-associated phospholipid phosphatase